MLTLIIFLAVLSVLVVVHEFGHFFVARRLGVRVDEFGFGFPPRLWSTKPGDTVYSVNWVPLGGFVRLKGETGEDLHHHDSFAGKSVWRRLAIVIAGVVMNLVLAVVLFSVGLTLGLPQASDDLPRGAVAKNEQVAVGQVLQSSPADEAGMAPGDIIISFDGNRLVSSSAVQSYVAEHSDAPIEIIVSRFGEEKNFAVTPQLLGETGQVGLGVGLFSVSTVSYPWYLAPVRAIQLTAFLTSEIARAFVGIIQSLVTEGRLGIELAGPVGIAVLSGQAAELGVVYLLQFVAILSINLAVINVLPFPALDGGRLLFLVIEKIRGRPVSRQLENVVHQVGFVLLLALVLLVTYRDLARFSDNILNGIRNLF